MNEFHERAFLENRYANDPASQASVAKEIVRDLGQGLVLIGDFKRMTDPVTLAERIQSLEWDLSEMKTTVQDLRDRLRSI